MAHNPDKLDMFMTHRGRLVNYANRIVGDRADAEDVVQDAYLRFEGVADDRPVDEPLAYLYRIVRNLSLDLRRRLGRDRLRLVAEDTGVLAGMAEDRPSPEAEIGARRALQRVTDAMAELPERTRIALEMHRFGGCSIREIARHLNISTGLAHALVVQGLEHCRQRLHQDGHHD
ncbi:DNA-directed RNA polymerase sigma-70 factor [Tistrella bauzanensis]|uniref:DNA-directed RNA polymerase sigma-70 factor n=1 Tax=Tistrella bauzanensis TaxID=657419 RepID=A0ABQ1IE95_9PROT|nr:sigma-70 family RNA polymerase sigma factor [Tistrella bauzanensis]GGB37203.1 DNA-directed RNA polymerase sigma-70 factor [Tistrella bauzanensis]